MAKITFEETVRSDGFVRIPSELQAKLQLRPGDRVLWRITRGGLLISRTPSSTKAAPTLEPPVSETRRKLRTFAARMDKSKDMLVTLREAREEAYQIVQANQEWTDARAAERKP